MGRVERWGHGYRLAARHKYEAVGHPEQRWTAVAWGRDLLNIISTRQVADVRVILSNESRFAISKASGGLMEEVEG